MYGAEGGDTSIHACTQGLVECAKIGSQPQASSSSEQALALSSSSRVLGPHNHKQEALLHLQQISNMFSVDER